MRILLMFLFFALLTPAYGFADNALEKKTTDYLITIKKCSPHVFFYELGFIRGISSIIKFENEPEEVQIHSNKLEAFTTKTLLLFDIDELNNKHKQNQKFKLIPVGPILNAFAACLTTVEMLNKTIKVSFDSELTEIESKMLAASLVFIIDIGGSVPIISHPKNLHSGEMFSFDFARFDNFINALLKIKMEPTPSTDDHDLSGFDDLKMGTPSPEVQKSIDAYLALTDEEKEEADRVIMQYLGTAPAD